MADASSRLTAAYAALGAIQPAVPVRLSGEPAPEGEREVLVLALVSDTGRPAYGGTPTDTLIQITAYAPTLLRALALDGRARTALAAVGLHYRQSRMAPDPDSIGVISEFTS